MKRKRADQKSFSRLRKIITVILCVCAAVTALCFIFPLQSKASGDLDEILNYVITVDVNDDATLHMVYHIDWKVLDSTSDGPLSWVIIGTPNKHCSDIKALSSNIKDIRYTSDKGSGMKITFDRDYYQDEVISFDFELTQDYMYQMNLLTDGETVYSFTPGWFDDINVDHLGIIWNADKVISASPAAIIDNGYYEWDTSLSKGAQFKVDITYPNDAFAFSKDKKIAGQSKLEKLANKFLPLIVVVGPFAAVMIFIFGIKFIADLIGWVTSAGFSATETKIQRTVIEYYPNCPGCGAPRPEGAENCVYCGMNFVKSEKIVEETKVPKQFSSFKDEIFGHSDAGTYKVSSSPNTVVRVAPIIVPARTSFASYVRAQNAASASRGGGGHSGGCAHSSCACACACACAGGGRAGCTAKDFHKTNLKMKYFEEK